MRRFIERALLGSVALAQIACSSATTGSTPRGPSPDGLSPAEMEEIYNARIERDRTTRFTDADVRFMNDMIHHHAQAVQMARMVPSRTQTASLRTLAGRIINAQMDEIDTMQRWLRVRGRPVPEVHVTDTEVVVHGGGHGEHAAHVQMPGMISAEQLRRLEQSRGADFDRLFLTYMIEHHRGAVGMVRELFATDGAGQDEEVFKFASDVQVDQTTEVARMELMLRSMGGDE